MKKEDRDAIAILASRFLEGTSDLMSATSAIEEVIDRHIGRVVNRKIVEKGVAALNSFDEYELEWYGKHLAPKVDAQIRSSRDTAAVGRLTPPFVQYDASVKKGGRS